MKKNTPPERNPAVTIEHNSPRRHRPQTATMKTVATLSLLAASASAFAPSKNAERSSALSMAFENELGVQPPVRFQELFPPPKRKFSMFWGGWSLPTSL